MTGMKRRLAAIMQLKLVSHDQKGDGVKFRVGDVVCEKLPCEGDWERRVARIVGVWLQGYVVVWEHYGETVYRYITYKVIDDSFELQTKLEKVLK